MAELDNVVVVRFEDPSKAFEALSVLKACDAQGRIGLGAAEVVERSNDGVLTQREGAGEDPLSATASGSLIGVLIGVLGGPLGVLLGLGTGALVGAAVDADRADAYEDALSQMAQAIPPGSTALVAAVSEPAIEVVDGEMAKLGGEVTRRPRAEVLAELEAADEAADAAAREARRAIREQRTHEAKEEWSERVARLKERLKRS